MFSSRDGRIFYPLEVSYNRGCEGSKENLLVVDCLMCQNVALANGHERRMFTRDFISLPWTPRLFVACRRDYSRELRSQVGLALLAHGRSDKSSMMRVLLGNITFLGRDTTHMFWRRTNDAIMYELTFENFSDRRIVKNYLRDNSVGRSMDYALFAVDDNVAFEVALTSAVRNGERSNKRDETIDLESSFTYASWCYCNVAEGDYIRRLTDEEVVLNDLPDNPLVSLPILSYDLETIAKNDAILPRGVEEDQRLASAAVSVHCPWLKKTFSVTMVLVPSTTEDELLKTQNKFEKIASLADGSENERFDSIRMYSEETKLLADFVYMMRNNVPLIDAVEPTDLRIVGRLACILIGYNCWSYDYPFLIDRLCYHGMYSEMFEMMKFRHEPRFARSQISFDVMKHIISRYKAQVGSVSLSHVSRFFGAEDESLNVTESRAKMKFDSVSIRHLYFDEHHRERFDRERALRDAFPNEGLNLLRVILYNIRDCTAVYHLTKNICFYDNVISYSRHFFVSLIRASYVGNSNLLPNAFASFALRDASLVLSYRRNNASSLTISRKRRKPSRVVEAIDRRNREEETRLGVTVFDGINAFATIGDLNRLIVSRHEVFRELDSMRVDSKRVYVGGINSATPGFYENTFSVDFASFYPSIGCAFKLSMETVRILTVSQLIASYGDDVTVDAALGCGALRVFDYEPIESVAVKRRIADGRFFLKGVDDVASATIAANDGWYEGVEFADCSEMTSSSVDPDERRVLAVRMLHYDYEPLICNLWRYYLNQRAVYKAKLKTTTDVVSRNIYTCQEKMYKVVANSLYGYLNYEHSALYAPSVAAAVTLLSRKTFHEMTLTCQIECEQILSKRPCLRNPVICKTIYRDTDGAILHTSERLTREEECIIVDRVNQKLYRPNKDAGKVYIESEESDTALCCIMGRKKYWRMKKDMTSVTKGFEKNAPTFVKSIVSTLERAVYRFLSSSCIEKPCAVCIMDPIGFSKAFYSAMHEYYRSNDVREFSFNMPLNPRETEGAESTFIRNTLTKYSYDEGDRVCCVYRLNEEDPRKAEIMMTNEFRQGIDQINYYKNIRRYAAYFFQLVEGKRPSLTGVAFDDMLSEAYSSWLTKPTLSGNAYEWMYDPTSIEIGRGLNIFVE